MPARSAFAARTCCLAAAGFVAFLAAAAASAGLHLCDRTIGVAGACPIVVYTAFLAAVLTLCAAAALAAERAGAGKGVRAACALVAGAGPVRLCAVLGALGFAPLAAVLASEPGVALTGAAAAWALGLLAAGAVGGGIALCALARAVVRLGAAVLAAFFARLRRARSRRGIAAAGPTGTSFSRYGLARAVAPARGPPV